MYLPWQNPYATNNNECTQRHQCTAQSHVDISAKNHLLKISNRTENCDRHFKCTLIRDWKMHLVTFSKCANSLIPQISLNTYARWATWIKQIRREWQNDTNERWKNVKKKIRLKKKSKHSVVIIWFYLVIYMHINTIYSHILKTDGIWTIHRCQQARGLRDQRFKHKPTTQFHSYGWECVFFLFLYFAYLHILLTLTMCAWTYICTRCA